MKTFRFSLLLLSILFFFGGCQLVWNGVQATPGVWRETVGAASWAHNADLGDGVVTSVEERTRKNGRLQAKFRGSVECWTVSYDEPLSGGGKVLCQAIFPNEWNGKLWLIANDRPDGELPARAVSFAQDGSAVVCGDGGLGQVRRRNGRVNALAAGARSPELRKAFFQEALGLALEGGRMLARRKYKREPDVICCYGRENGGAQALFLVSKDPKAVDELVLVNPAADFARCIAYDLNIARQYSLRTSYARLVRPEQFANLRRAAQDLKMSSFDPARTNELWAAAGKYDDSFSHDPELARQVSAAWQMLLAPTSSVPAVRLDMDFEPRLRERQPWRLAWLFGDADGNVQEAGDLDSLEGLGDYTPPTDLKDFFAAGGRARLILESSNAYVPAQVAEKLSIPDTRRVEKE